jgi:hypothetical protein
MIVANAGRDAVDAKVTKTNVADADGEVVWSWRPTLAPSFAELICEVTVAKEPGSPGRARSKP